MNPKHYAALLAAQTQVARKVLDAVPLQVAWPSRKILQEIIRAGVGPRDLRIIEGCLNTLVDCGLVRELPHGEYIRIPCKEVEDEQSVVLDGESATEETAEPPVASNVVPIIADEPFRMVKDETPPLVEDVEYEHYLALRTERAISMLKLLSENVDEEIGLALLEVADELDETHNSLIEYRISLFPVEGSGERMELNPGWYQHTLDGRVFFTRQEQMTPAEMKAFLEANPNAVVFLTTEGVVNLMNQHEFMVEENSKRVQEVFAKFEPEGGRKAPYCNSLLRRVKKHLPDIEPPVKLELVVEEPSIPEAKQERKRRKKLCDVKIKGVAQTAEYRAWAHICAPSSLESLAEIGLGVDDSWRRHFSLFLKDVGYRPEFGARLCRIDRTKGWYADNVAWMKDSKPLEGRRRKPKGWPLMMEEKDKIARRLSGLSKQVKGFMKKLQN